ncbi:hypothetical protein BT69DRAFT_1309358 [Atractiella rhizophila]|nr:hypothetical protein BT69DRAFT_1309358 [Atractiella rhizophila]
MSMYWGCICNALDCSPTNRERELGLDRRETVIQLSTRGTVDSDNWYLRLSDRAMARSYHLLDYG